ncbi:hypothetical protein M231_07593 [Tremella mesenterica]|uniref:Rrn7/TAF1B C-terminal cyclin domain-containing protein n=1 Tax=Tremella mesenterica TaxID=5217 RepID=A0A4Q1BDX2_TREME|nr:hypothetical protein M231_07593 [Tremella mesenterica]
MVRACPICGSKTWRKDRVTGKSICEEGHVYQDFRSENLVTEATPHALQRRRERKGPRINKRKEHGAANVDYYHGDDAEYLRIQAVQLLLRHQVIALRESWDLPDLFERVVRDLWTYQLSISPMPQPPGEQAYPEQGHAFFSQPDPTVAVTAPELEAVADDELAEDEKDDPDSDSELEDHKSDEPDIDSDILMELSERDSDSDEKQHPATEEANTGGIQRTRHRRIAISDTLITLLVGMWILRIPVLFVDMESLVNMNRIPYLDFGRSTLISYEMRKHINRAVMLALCPGRSPSPSTLFRRCKEFAQVLGRRFGLKLPECNISPLAWRLLSTVGGTPTMYSQVTHLLALLDINLFLDSPDLITVRRRSQRRASSPDADRSINTYRRSARHHDAIMPEMVVMVAWIIVMKMTYGLDGQKRHDDFDMDLAYGLPRLETWIKELRERVSSGVLKSDRHNLDKKDFYSMEMDDIDRYLDASEAILLKDRDLTFGGPFPIPTSHPAPPKIPPPNSWAAFHASFLRPQSTNLLNMPTDEVLPSPGEFYTSFIASDVGGVLPNDLQVLMDAASQVIHVDPREMNKTLEILETRLRSILSNGWRSRSRSRSDRGRPRSTHLS